ncbi:MAG: hypothetical protein ABII88_09765 [Candidatus Omnitrophota bacterium]
MKNRYRTFFISSLLFPIGLVLIARAITGDYVQVVPFFLLLTTVLICIVFYFHKLMVTFSADLTYHRILYDCVDFETMKKRTDTIKVYLSEYDKLAKLKDKITPKERDRANMLFEILTLLGEEISYFDLAVFLDSRRCPFKFTRHFISQDNAARKLKTGFCWASCFSFQTIIERNDGWREGMCSKCGHSYKPTGWMWPIISILGPIIGIFIVIIIKIFMR